MKQSLIKRIITLESGLNKWTQKIDLNSTCKRNQSVIDEAQASFSSSIFVNSKNYNDEETRKSVRKKPILSPSK